MLGLESTAVENGLLILLVQYETFLAVVGFDKDEGLIAEGNERGDGVEEEMTEDLQQEEVDQ